MDSDPAKTGRRNGHEQRKHEIVCIVGSSGYNSNSNKVLVEDGGFTQNKYRWHNCHKL